MGLPDILGLLSQKSLNIALNVSKPTLKHLLHEQFKKIAIRSVVKLVTTFTAIIIVIWQPFAQQTTEWIASLVFILLFLWTFFSILLTLAKNFYLAICIYKEKSISKGIVAFLVSKYKVASIGIISYKVAKYIGGNFSQNFATLPEPSDIVKEFLRYLVKDILFFAILFFLYVSAVNLGFKPFLLQKYANLSTFQLYCFPIIQVVKLIQQ